MPKQEKISLFGLVRFIPGKNKISVIPSKGLPPGVHVTLHFGGASGLMDVHLTHESSGRHETLWCISTAEVENLGQYLLHRYAQAVLSRLALEEVRECFYMAVTFPPEGSPDAQTVQALINKFCPSRKVRGTVHLIETGLENLFGDPAFRDEIVGLVQIVDISDFAPVAGSAGFLIAHNGTTIGFNAESEDAVFLTDTAALEKLGPEEFVGAEFWGLLRARYDHILETFSHL